MVKIKLILSLVMIFAVLTAFIIKSLPSGSGAGIKTLTPPVNGISNDFLVGFIHDGMNTSFNIISDTFGFNLWHVYCPPATINGKHLVTGWKDLGATGDSLYAGNGYQGQVTQILQNISSHNMKALIQRPKIEYLCYGQRSDYQCEDTSLIQDKDLWFYTFQSPSHTGHDISDSGAVVRFCNANSQGPNQDPPGL